MHLRCKPENYLRTFVAVALIIFLAPAVRAEISLPNCIDSNDDIAAIQAAQKANPKTQQKYAGYRKLLATDTPLQLATRLAYAETLAANCPQQNDQVAERVAAVIGNRIRIRQGDAHSVVFQRDQFSSSLNIYPESRYREFLCPKDGGLWNSLYIKMRNNLSAPASDTNIPTDAVNYYLYRHNERFTAPDWKLTEAAIKDEKTRECIRVFRAPGWK